MIHCKIQINRINNGFCGNKPFTTGTVNDWSGPSQECELVFRVSGQSIINWGEYSYTEQPYIIRLMPPREKMHRYVTKTLEPGDYYLLSFESGGKPFEFQYAPVKNHESIAGIFEKLWRVWTMRQDGWYNQAMSTAYNILYELEQETYLPSEKVGLLAPAISHIEAHLTENIDVTRLHELCGIGYTYFKQLFIRKYGLPPQRYITRLKMNIACEQLSQAMLSVSEIANQLGYGSLHYFTRQFHNEIGCAPSEYRRHIKSPVFKQDDKA